MSGIRDREHSPLSLFGCSVTWGNQVAGYSSLQWADVRTHCCDLDVGHDGPCRCRCGEERPVMKWRLAG